MIIVESLKPPMYNYLKHLFNGYFLIPIILMYSAKRFDLAKRFIIVHFGIIGMPFCFFLFGIDVPLLTDVTLYNNLFIYLSLLFTIFVFEKNNFKRNKIWQKY